MKNVIVIAERGGENKKLLTMENAIKTILAEISKVSNAIDLRSKYSWAINNADMDAAENLRLIDIQKYWRRASQIQDKVDRLYKD